MSESASSGPGFVAPATLSSALQRVTNAPQEESNSPESLSLEDFIGLAASGARLSARKYIEMLMQSQEEIQKLRIMNKELTAENTTLRLSLRTEKQSNSCAKINRASPIAIDFSKLTAGEVLGHIRVFARFFQLFYSWTINVDVFTVNPRPTFLANSVERFETDTNIALGATAELQEYLPPVVLTMACSTNELRSEFINTLAASRSSLLHTIKGVAPEIFGFGSNSFFSKHNTRINDPHVRMLLGAVNGPNHTEAKHQYIYPNERPPILYLDNDCSKITKLFCNPALFKIAQVILYGPKCLENGRMRFRGSSPFRVDPKCNSPIVTPGLIANICIYAIYILSDDTELNASGEGAETHIKYIKLSDLYKQIIVTGLQDSRKAFVALFRKWTEIVFPNAVGESTIFGSTDIDADLALVDQVPEHTRRSEQVRAMFEELSIVEEDESVNDDLDSLTDSSAAIIQPGNHRRDSHRLESPAPQTSSNFPTPHDVTQSDDADDIYPTDVEDLPPTRMVRTSSTTSSARLTFNSNNGPPTAPRHTRHPLSREDTARPLSRSDTVRSHPRPKPAAMSHTLSLPGAATRPTDKRASVDAINAIGKLPSTLTPPLTGGSAPAAARSRPSSTGLKRHGALSSMLTDDDETDSASDSDNNDELLGLQQIQTSGVESTTMSSVGGRRLSDNMSSLAPVPPRQPSRAQKGNTTQLALERVLHNATPGLTVGPISPQSEIISDDVLTVQKKTRKVRQPAPGLVSTSPGPSGAQAAVVDAQPTGKKPPVRRSSRKVT